MCTFAQKYSDGKKENNKLTGNMYNSFMDYIVLHAACLQQTVRFHGVVCNHIICNNCVCAPL